MGKLNPDKIHKKPVKQAAPITRPSLKPIKNPTKQLPLLSLGASKLQSTLQRMLEKKNHDGLLILDRQLGRRSYLITREQYEYSPEKAEQDSLARATTPLSLLNHHCHYGHQPEVEQILSAHPELINTPSIGGYTALSTAAFMGHLPIVQLLVEQYQADIDAQNYDGSTALHRACIFAKVPVVEYLLSKGADIFAKNISGETVLKEALLFINESHQHPERLKLLQVLTAHGLSLHAQPSMFGQTLESYVRSKLQGEPLQKVMATLGVS